MTQPAQPPSAGLTLAEGMRQSELDYPELWTRYLAIGGLGSLQAVRDHVTDGDCPDDHEHNLIAQVLNDAALDQGRDHPVAYRHLYRRPDGPGTGSGGR